MTALFIACAVAGGALLAVQLLLGIFGVADIHVPGFEHGAHGGELAADTLNLLSFRALTTGALFFGLVGMAVQEGGLGLLALPLAFAAGLAAAASAAWIIQAMVRAESDGAARLHEAVGQSGTVYLGIPPGRIGRGKVHITLGGRLVECQAQAEQALATGSAVLVIDVVGPDVVEVIPSPSIGV